MKVELRCAHCECTYLTWPCKAKIAEERGYSFCSRKCVNLASYKDGFLHKVRQQTCEKIYGEGITSPTQAAVVQEKRQQTCLDRFGVKSTFELPVVREKSRLTLHERYGVDTPFSSPEIREKAVLTLISRYGKTNPVYIEASQEKAKRTRQERYGVNYTFQSPEIRRKSTQTILERFGVTSPAKSEIVREKTQKTFQQRFGVNTPMESQECRDNFKSSMLSKHGVESPFQLPKTREACSSPAARKKAHETMKQNGTYGKSNSEDECFKLLCNEFGEQNVQRQVVVNNWPIDFYVKSIDTYVQFDGVYWHGLDRHIDEITKHKCPRDISIHQKYLTDLKQNPWFETHEMKLVRITEIEFHDNGIGKLLQ